MKKIQSSPQPLHTPDFKSYDRIIVFHSAGKDSSGTFLHLLEQGVDPSKIELWHHEIDGREGNPLMDWTCTPGYTASFAKAFGVPVYNSWRMGGFEREMLRDNSNTAPVRFETPDGSIGQAGGVRHSPGTRLRFPQVSANLAVRYCSSVCKIDVAGLAFRHQERFKNTRTLVCTGERAQESPARAKYEVFQTHRDDARTGKRTQRHIDHWRPVHHWSESDVWNILKRWEINVHPAYKMGWNRCSCGLCIFSLGKSLATFSYIAQTMLVVDGIPDEIRSRANDMLEKVIAYEEKFGWTIHRKYSVRERIAANPPLRDIQVEDMIAAFSSTWEQPIFTDNWQLPLGAFGVNDGPS